LSIKLINEKGLPINLKDEVVKVAGKLLGVRVDESTMHPGFGDEWWGNGDDERTGSKKKAVYTEAFWLAPPYGRPRDIDYQRLEKLEKSVWIRMCAQHIIDSVAGADWNIVPYKEGEEVSAAVIDETTEFFESRAWANGFSMVLRAMLPEFLYYDCGVLLKAFPISAYDEDQKLKKKTGEAIKPVELYSRDGRSFLKDTSLYGKLGQYWQYSWLNPQGRPIQFDPDEIIYIQQYPSSREPYGSCTLETIESVIGYMMSSTLAQEKYWDNGLFIGGQIDLPELKDIDEIKRAQAYYEAKLRGPRKYNKWIVTGGGASVKSMPFTPQQMEWLDSQKWFAKLVFAVFKVSPSELGFTEDLNRATGIQQMQIHKMKSIQPILRILEEYFNREIVWKHFSKDVKFEYVRELDLEEKEKQAGIDEKRLGSGLNSVNELRDRDGLEKWEDEKYDKPNAGAAEEGGEGDDSGQSGQMGGEGEEDDDDWGWGETVNFIDSALNVMKGKPEIKKAANVGAVSGKEGFVPMPEAYGPVRTEEEEMEILEETKEYWKKVREGALEDYQKIFKGVLKGGVGSGIKGHKTFGDEEQKTSPGILSAIKDWDEREGAELEIDFDESKFEFTEEEEEFMGEMYEKYLDSGKSIPEKLNEKYADVEARMLNADLQELVPKELINVYDKAPDVKAGEEDKQRIADSTPEEYMKYLGGLNQKGLREEQVKIEQVYPEIRTLIDNYIGIDLGSDTPKQLEAAATKAFGLSLDGLRDKSIKPTDNMVKGLQAMYMVTQSYLKRKYPEGKMTIYRGLKGDSKEEIDLKNATSWSVAQAEAEAFATDRGNSFVLKSEVPVGRILYHYDLVFSKGTKESELIVLGSKAKGEVVYEF
jgi:hypothetical protein